MPILIKNIRGLAGCYESPPPRLRGKEMAELPMIENAWLAIDDDTITAFGSMEEWEGISDWRNLTIIDASGRYVIPAFCDSHSHLVFAGSRELEFEDRIKGLTYEQIAARGGGILNSADKLRRMSEDELFEAALIRLKAVMHSGTGAIEIKSGYGLNTESELRMLRVARRLGELGEVLVRTTFLGAHAIPAEFKSDRDSYLRLIKDEMLPAIAAEGLADYVDAFCESGYFSTNETLSIVDAAAKYGLKAKIHVNQFNALGAVPALVKAGAVSLDHLEVMNPEDFAALSGSETIATALPLCSLFLGIPYTPARELIDGNATVALASDYNPGSAPSGNMALAVSLACIRMRLTPTEAINAATINGAAAMGLEGKVGVIAPGALANIIITEPCEHLSYLPYSFGTPAISGVIVRGKVARLDESLA